MNGAGPLKLAFMAVGAFLLIVVGISGKLGSLLGAMIDPANMEDKTGGSSGSSATISPAQASGATNNVTLNATQIASYASGAGFTGNGLITIIAIALAESGGQTHPKDNVNADGSRDRGLYQINSRWHPEVSDNQAYNAVSASQAAFRISRSGTNFTQWATYNNGAYKRFLTQAQQAS